MQEIITEALILDHEPFREADRRVHLYTKLRGKLTARATGVRKPLSKLASHLEPGMVSQVRLVGFEGSQLTDAISLRRLPLTPRRAELFQLVCDFVLPHDPDLPLWEILTQARDASGRELLEGMGFDPEHGACGTCERRAPEFFHFRDAFYLCESCAVRRGAGVAAHLFRWSPE